MTLSLKIYFKKHRGSHRIENKSPLRGLRIQHQIYYFKKLNIIYKKYISQETVYILGNFIIKGTLFLYTLIYQQRFTLST